MSKAASKAYSKLSTGKLSGWSEKSFEAPGHGTIMGKMFLQDQLQLTGCQISINSYAPGESMPIHHSHKENEEVYIFLSGKGQMQIDGETFDVAEGDVVRVATGVDRIWRNNGAEVMTYLVMQVREGSLNQCNMGDAIIPEKAVSWPV
ncbi:MAG: cupin domain-containing protein [Micavibrio sp.]|nr:cupin domain-containing protein [Micavibrio sp.]